ncbi:(2Fe-2S)-binding protein [Craterilacuibacter sp.]|uniref:(2Fe-2S)-binding protein n=1 Tax=Craterilacuibacter sp. TaxID=2870909 RepID=UPI003F39D31A
MYVCLCYPTTESQIRQAALNGARHLRDIRPVATQCGKCGHCAHAMLKQAGKALLPALFKPGL